MRTSPISACAGAVSRGACCVCSALAVVLLMAPTPIVLRALTGPYRKTRPGQWYLWSQALACCARSRAMAKAPLILSASRPQSRRTTILLSLTFASPFWS
jgi:hypothetical protein